MTQKIHKLTSIFQLRFDFATSLRAVSLPIFR